MNYIEIEQNWEDLTEWMTDKDEQGVRERTQQVAAEYGFDVDELPF